MTYEIEWRNSDGTEGDYLEEVLLRAQDPSIDWAALAQLNPYPGQAIKDDRLLAGRCPGVNAPPDVVRAELEVLGRAGIGRASCRERVCLVV